MTYDYTFKKPLEEIAYYSVLNPYSPHNEWAMNTVMKPAFLALKKEYNVHVQPLAFGTMPIMTSQKMIYVIYGPTNPLQMRPSEMAYLSKLSAGGCKTNIISAYPLTHNNRDKPNYDRAKTAVPALCEKLNVNALFPDFIDSNRGVRTNDWQDIYANAVSETIRVKYCPIPSQKEQDHSLLHELHDKHRMEIEQLAKLYSEFRLWQRDPASNGAILFGGENYWYCTQTLTDKTAMTPANYDLITGYDEQANTLTYAGSKLPSSDAPEFLLLSQYIKKDTGRPNLIVHFHHNELTRGKRFRELVTNDKLEGGRFATGHKYYQQLRSTATDWFIVREHGVVWTGDSVDSFEQFIRNILQ